MGAVLLDFSVAFDIIDYSLALLSPLYCGLYFIYYFISPLFNQVGQLRTPLFNQVGKLRTSSHLQLRPGQDKAKQCDTNNNTELHME